eukprot:CAMPEP_0185580944 /NCGR_PEP_ID=MMETSP0434-20130131/18003_1 /TAXON_ID=626734 ORGANISM="Favella taraikaensis, Strain Fe Narragansett Bay" /NCGR_SAMPLE_ID=MMETSP0434 /ASSEMBLY_ACC=CAM_ASM_000379 /LENGTH=153 /DNA_ID=CAMNT_0028199355 /DNA_START=642 /DNA_END=1105 /DNA_ORIENTATION=-
MKRIANVFQGNFEDFLDTRDSAIVDHTRRFGCAPRHLWDGLETALEDAIGAAAARISILFGLVAAHVTYAVAEACDGVGHAFRDSHDRIHNSIHNWVENEADELGISLGSRRGLRQRSALLLQLARDVGLDPALGDGMRLENHNSEAAAITLT